MGRLLFYMLWPLVWVHAPLTRRVRLVILYNGQFIAVKKSFGPGIWQLPGGGIKISESVQAAAMREAEEELGLQLKKVYLLHNDIKIVRQFGLLMRYHFVCVELDSKIDLKKSKELTSAAWLKIDSSEQMSKEVKTGLALARQQG